MYPDESFVGVGVAEVEKRSMEEDDWWRWQKSRQLGNGRVGWVGERCGWWYWVGMPEFEDLDEL
jgi:hypothetical protein